MLASCYLIIVLLNRCLVTLSIGIGTYRICFFYVSCFLGVLGEVIGWIGSIDKTVEREERQLQLESAP